MSDTPAEPPSPRFDYTEAANRHFRDAEALGALTPPRMANADHLYGIAAECALLGILQTDPTKASSFSADGGLDDRWRKHINVLWGMFCHEIERHRSLGFVMSHLRSEFPEQPRRPGDRPRFPSNPFKGWSVDQRYLSEASVATEIHPGAVEQHQRAAKHCLQLLDKARSMNHPKGKS
ncbi:MAG TPA: hypothetical protein VM694_40815 [Polyangium sp.]|nr:hypothetical protein [Polyangium sp.]